MNKSMPVLSVLALVFMAAAAGWLNHSGHHQTLSPPGVKTHALGSSIRLEADLPEHVLDYTSKALDPEDIVLATLPADTSFGFRRYVAPDKFTLDLRVVLMGRDRTSLHKPQICLSGQGWRIDDSASEETGVRVQRPHSYDLPIVKLIANSTATIDGQDHAVSGVYVYWYVAHDGLSASATGLQRMWWMATRLLRTGVLERWAYVSCFASCAPGYESATYNRIKEFIADAVPQFQLYPSPETSTTTAAR
jgi:hypothetical protein